MIGTDQRLRRSALAILAAGVALGVSACGAGQISQTSSQVAAVDGGSSHTQDISVDDVRVIISDSGDAELAFIASYYGTSLGDSDGISLEGATVDSQPAQMATSEPLMRGCTLVALPSHLEPEDHDDAVCIDYTEATLPNGDDFDIAQSVPAEFTFSNGETLTVNAGVVGEHSDAAGEYTRPSEPHSTNGGH